MTGPAAKPRQVRPGYWSYGCGTVLFAAAAAFLGTVVYVGHAGHVKPMGVVEPDRWPLALAENYERWQSGRAKIDAIEVFATNEDMLGGSAILKVPDRPETWEYLKTLCSTDVMESPEAARERWEEVGERFPGWAPDLDDPNVEVLSRSGSSDATMLRVARDPANGTIYIDYYFDF